MEYETRPHTKAEKEETEIVTVGAQTHLDIRR